jgi:hypothetical protein
MKVIWPDLRYAWRTLRKKPVFFAVAVLLVALGIGAHPLRTLVVGAEIAVSGMVLIGAGLLIHSFSKLINVDPGFNPQGVLSARLFLPGPRYAKDPRIVNYWSTLPSSCHRRFARSGSTRYAHRPGQSAALRIS